MTVAGFLYFIDDRTDDGRALRLLESVTIGAELVAEDVLRGPSGGAGLLIAFKPAARGGRLPAMRYAPDWQQWAPVAGGLFIGYEIGDRPRPIDVQRTKLLDGHAVRLSDGHDWTVPILRTIEGYLHVPATSPLGEMLGVLYESLAGRITGQVNVDLRGKPLLAAAVLALGRNYRVDLWEWQALGLGKNGDLGEILSAAIDVPALLAMAADANGEQISITM